MHTCRAWAIFVAGNEDNLGGKKKLNCFKENTLKSRSASQQKMFWYMCCRSEHPAKDVLKSCLRKGKNNENMKTKETKNL